MASYETIQADFYDYSAKASQAVRTSAVSGVGAVWIVSQTHLDSKTLLFGHLQLFETSAFLFILALAFDLLHGFITSIVYWFWLNSIDKEYDRKPVQKIKADIPYNNWARRTPWFFYCLKALSILAATGYLLVGVYLVL